MTHKFKCPICGTTVHKSTLEKFYPINFFNVRGLGRGKGFSFTQVEDPSLLLKIKNKIRILYERFFDGIQEEVVIPGSFVKKIRIYPSERLTFAINSPSIRSKFVIKEKMSFDLR